jgi:hypothetical protein
MGQAKGDKGRREPRIIMAENISKRIRVFAMMFSGAACHLDGNGCFSQEVLQMTRNRRIRWAQSLFEAKLAGI